MARTRQWRRNRRKKRAKCWLGCRKSGTCMLLKRTWKATTAVENDSFSCNQTQNCCVINWPLLDTSKPSKADPQLFIIAKTRKKPTCPPTEEHKIQCLSKAFQYLALEGKSSQTQATEQKSLEDTRLSEISRPKTPCMVPLPWCASCS